MDETKDQVILTTFQAGLLPRYFFFSVNKTLPKIVPELLHNTYKYMNAKDACVSKGMLNRRRKKDDHIDHRPEKKRDQRSIKHVSERKEAL